LDLQKLLSLRAAEFHLTITERNGEDLDKRADLHTLMQVQEI
jgi:carbohydrate-selective porin OprB